MMDSIKKDNKMEENDSKLRTLQLTMLEMLRLVDKICRDNDIQYSLCSGTLLGAVRHKGFIPWDDDLDIRMTRENYDKFLKTWDQLQPEGYFLQNKENSPNFPSSFSKIRKNNTAFVTNEWEKGQFHTGVFIDVFVFDRIPQGKIKKLFFKLGCLKYQIYTRENHHEFNNIVVSAVIRIIMRITTSKGRMKYRKRFIDKLRKIDKDTSLPFVSVSTPRSLNYIFPSNIADEYVDIPFENSSFMSFKNWDEFLKIEFGNYMQLPPENERSWQHHPVVIDFEHSWEEIEAMNKDNDNHA